MTLRIGINGFGRIGRCFARLATKHQGVDLVATNDLSDVASLAHLFKWDSIHRKFDGTVETDGKDLIINGDRLKVLAEKDPSKLGWGDLGVDVVIESTGRFTKREQLEAHLAAGAKKVILSAPAKGAIDGTFVMGVNENTYDPGKMHVVSNASCTTNCIAPLAKVLHDSFGIVQGLMTTIHSYTNDQMLLDGIHKDLRRARAGAMSQIPTTTGAAKAVGAVLPELKGKLNGLAIRVPTPDVSLVDLVATTDRAVSVEAINAAYKEAAGGPLKGYVQYVDEPLVSSDFIGNTYSTIFDSELTTVQGDRLAKVMAWYDNEWGYSARLLDLAVYVGERL